MRVTRWRDVFRDGLGRTAASRVGIGSVVLNEASNEVLYSPYDYTCMVATYELQREYIDDHD